MAERLLLGYVREDYKNGDDNFIAGEAIYLSKHSWDCGWYWGFGYVGNKHLHTHFNSAFLGTAVTDVKEIFSYTKLRQDDWWILRDLFVQAYALKKCAEVYRHGGHQTSRAGITDIVQSKELENRLNADLEKVLNKIWEIVTIANG